MATLAYPPHPANDFAFGRQPSQNFSRRQSFHSGYGGQPQVAFPYSDQHAGMYPDQPSLHGEVGGKLILLSSHYTFNSVLLPELSKAFISDLRPTREAKSTFIR